MKTLVVLILMMGYVAAVFYYTYVQSKNTVQEEVIRNDKLTQAIEPKMAANSDLYPVKVFPRDGKFKFLPKNTTLVEIAEDVRFVRTFDKARYADLLLHMDKLQKTYMYLLSDRYTCQTGISSLLDLRGAVAEILYSMYLIVPKTMKHAYGLDPFKVLDQNIQKFTALTRTMLQVVEGHCKTPIPYTQPYDSQRMRPDRMP